jgi:unspecific peroxygenase
VSSHARLIFQHVYHHHHSLPAIGAWSSLILQCAGAGVILESNHHDVHCEQELRVMGTGARAELRWQRFQDSIATNPTFSLLSPRYYTAYAEMVFPLVFFVDGRVAKKELSLTDARGFFQNCQMPADFYRSNVSIGFDIIGGGISRVFAKHPIQLGKNKGVGNYTLNPTFANFTQFCELYTSFVNETVLSLYPHPTGVLLNALQTNLNYFYSALNNSCPQVFPYGK